jgi:hypothetical protein
MEFLKVQMFKQDNEELEPYCDICGEYEEDIAQGKFIAVNYGQYDNLTLCPPCSKKLVSGLSSVPETEGILDLDTGSYKTI